MSRADPEWKYEAWGAIISIEPIPVFNKWGVNQIQLNARTAIVNQYLNLRRNEINGLKEADYPQQMYSIPFSNTQRIPYCGSYANNVAFGWAFPPNAFPSNFLPLPLTLSEQGEPLAVKMINSAF